MITTGFIETLRAHLKATKVRVIENQSIDGIDVAAEIDGNVKHASIPFSQLVAEGKTVSEDGFEIIASALK